MRLCGQVDVCAPLSRVQTSTAICKYVHTADTGVRGVAAKQLLHLKTCAGGRRQKLKRRQPGWVAVTQPKVSGHKAHACPLMAKEISEAVLCKKEHKFSVTLFENFQRSAGARDRFVFLQ